MSEVLEGGAVSHERDLGLLAGNEDHSAPLAPKRAFSTIRELEFGG